jgi:hypothetical protein
VDRGDAGGDGGAAYGPGGSRLALAGSLAVTVVPLWLNDNATRRWSVL